MQIQYKNMKNSIKTKELSKSKTIRVLNKLDINWLVAFINPSVPCNGRMNTSEKMSVDSIQTPTLTAGTQIESG